MGNEPGSGRRLTGLAATRALRTLLCAGIAASWVLAEHARSHWLPGSSSLGGIIAMMCFGLAGSGLCIAGMVALRTAGQRQWRESRGRAFADHTAAIAAYVPEVAPGHPAHEERLAEMEQRLHAAETKSTEFCALMQIVINELGVDTGGIDETRPMLRVLPGGQAG